MLDVVRRELRRLSPDVRIDTEEIKSVLEREVIKREVLEGEKADQARRKASRVANNSLRAATQRKDAVVDEKSQISLAPVSTNDEEE